MAGPTRAISQTQRAVAEQQRQLQGRISRASIERMLRSQQGTAALLAAIEKVYGDQEQVEAALARAMNDGFTQGYDAAGLSPDLGFPLSTAVAQNLAAQYSLAEAQMQQVVLTSVIRQGIPQGWKVRDVAETIHAIIGLNSRLAQAVIKYRDGLTSTHDAATANRMARTYAVRLLKYRARMIAATQANIARNTGLEVVWKTAVSFGVLPRSTRRVWVVTDDERLCPRCMELDGIAVALDEPWVLGGVRIWTPGTLHPFCRCEETLEIGRA